MFLSFFWNHEILYSFDILIKYSLVNYKENPDATKTLQVVKINFQNQYYVLVYKFYGMHYNPFEQLIRRTVNKFLITFTVLHEK